MANKAANDQAVDAAQKKEGAPPVKYTAEEICAKIEAWFQDRFRNKAGISDTDHFGYMLESKEGLKKLF